MAVSGSSGEIAFVNLLQVKATAGGTCRIRFEGPGGEGTLFLDEGIIVDARYGALEGEQAVLAALAEDDLYYLVKTDVAIPRRTLDLRVRTAVLEAVDQQSPRDRDPETGSVAVGVARAYAHKDPPILSPSQLAPADMPAALGGPTHDGPDAGNVKGAGRLVSLSTLIVLAVAVLVLVSWRAGSRSSQESPTRPPEASPSAADPAELLDRAVEASELKPSEDQLPQLLTGMPPAVPVAGATYVPTVICRLLIDEHGRVADASIYQSRDGLAPFESAALEAVGQFRFRPATQDASPVAVWINWPVDFLQ